MAVEDPLGVLNVDPALLGKIREVYAEIDKNSGNVAAATAQMSAELKKVAAQLGLIHERNEEIIAAEKLIDGMYKRRAIANKDINELLSANKKIRDDELTTEKERLLQIEKNFKIATERDRLIRDEVKNRDELIKKAQKERDLEYSRVRVLFNRGRIGKKERTAALRAAGKKFSKQEKYLKGLDKEFSSNQKILRNTRRNLDAQADQVENREKINKGMDTSVAFLDGMIEKTGFFSEKWKTGPLGGLTDFLDGGGDINDMFEEMALKAKKINLKNLSANVLKAIVEETLKWMMVFDKLTGEFRKNTGIIDKGFGGIEQGTVNVQRGAIAMGVSMEEAFGATNALVSEMADFTSMSKASREQVLKSTVLLQEFGVSAETTSQIFNTFSKGLGYNAQQLENLSTELMAIATSLKIPPQIIATEFNAASKELMKYGGDMKEVFKGLAEQSKQTGIAIGELLGIVKQYDTFEGAGEAVGKLNAILGGPYLNSINMLYATEEERVKMLRESISLSGRQFKDLSRFEQQAIATAAGITDMSVAARMFGGTDSEFAKTSMSMKEMEQKAKDAQAVQEKFTQAMQSFAIAMGPVVDALGAIMDALLVLVDPINTLADAFGVDVDDGLRGILQGVAMAGWGVIAMSKVMGKTWMKNLGPIMSGVLAFMAVQQILEGLPGPMKIAIGLLVALAAAFVLMKVAAGDWFAGAKFVANSVAVGAGTAGVVATLQGLGEAATGKNPGQEAGGNATLIGENGEEMVITEDGSRYMVGSPSVVNIDRGDAILNGADTAAAMRGESDGDRKMIAALDRNSASNERAAAAQEAAIVAQRQPKDDTPVIIKMKEDVVARSTIGYMKKHSNIKLA